MQAGERLQTIATKVLPPRCVGLIQRPRLLDFVTHVQAKRLSVIKAPAGFGKTSLAVAWADRLSQSDTSVAWLSIDPNDNQVTHFLFYLSHPLQPACASVGRSATHL